MKINELRKEIDKIDKQITDLLNRRVKIALKVAKIKVKNKENRD